MRILDHLEIPDFHEFITTPNNSSCVIIHSTRLMVEVLWWLQPANAEFGQSTFNTKLILDGSLSLVIRYKREKDEKYHPACVLSFNENNQGIHINHIQWSSDKSVAFRFHSSFNSPAFFLRLIEKSFIEKGIPVTVEKFPTGIEGASYSSRTSERYNIFWSAIEGLKKKYERVSHI